MTPKSEFEGWDVEGSNKTPLDQTDSTDGRDQRSHEVYESGQNGEETSEAAGSLQARGTRRRGCREAAHHSADGVQQLERDPHHTTASAENR